MGAAGEIYTLIVVPPQSAVARWLSERGRLTFIIIALLVSGVVSYLLARAISKPILRFRESTVAIAAGDLDTRIAPGVEKRRDEIGELAKDFNRMARELQLAWQRQAELTSNVSHELRSPLARLKVALELARRKTGELPELARIDAETERLDDIIGQLLAFSKLDAKTHEAAATVNLVELLAGDGHDDLALFGELDGVADQVDQDLAQTCRVRENAAGNGTPEVHLAAQSLLRRTVPHK